MLKLSCIYPNSIKCIEDAGCSMLSHLNRHHGIEADGCLSVCIDGDAQIGDGAFQEFMDLKEVYLPRSLKRIGCYAFGNCRDLASISLPDSVCYIGHSCFENCPSLSYVKMPQSCHVLHNNTFDGCISLPQIDIRGIYEIGQNCFCGCHSLKHVQFSSQLSSMKSRAFEYCHALEDIPEDMSQIEFGEDVFYECYEVSAAVMSDNAYARCQREFKRLYDEDLQRYCIQRFMEYAGKDPIVECNDYRHVYLNDEVVCRCAYENDYGISSLEFGPDVKKIEDYAFHRCHNLERIQFSNSLLSIGDMAFSSCYKLKDVKLPQSLQHIGKACFTKCYSLESISIPPRASSIEESVFSDCYSLKQASLPALERLPATTFMNDYQLAEVKAPCLSYCGDSSFENCFSLEKILTNKRLLAHEDAFINAKTDGIEYIVFSISSKVVL